MRTLSDWQATSSLLELGVRSLQKYDVYKACVSFAINGGLHEAEAELTAPYRELLEVRRLLKAQQMNLALDKLNAFQAPRGHERYFELTGDRDHLLGMAYHRLGDLPLSEEKLSSAIAFYRQGADEHRTLRALVNQKICRSTLETYTTGDLFFLKQRAAAAGFLDLVGNIEKAAVAELLLAGETTEAANAAERAIEAYRTDGCPEDRAVAQALLAIAQWLSGEKEAARATEKSLLIRNGKVEVYGSILAALFNGKNPVVPAGNPLAEVQWNASCGPRDNSIPGKILRRLQTGGAERDELIRSVWGENAIHPSYAGRLYTAIKDLRGKYKVPVVFDGARYCLENR